MERGRGNGQLGEKNKIRSKGKKMKKALMDKNNYQKIHLATMHLDIKVLKLMSVQEVSTRCISQLGQDLLDIQYFTIKHSYRYYILGFPGGCEQ